MYMRVDGSVVSGAVVMIFTLLAMPNPGANAQVWSPEPYLRVWRSFTKVNHILPSVRRSLSSDRSFTTCHQSE